ncbi:MAG: DUF5989 family protein [Planctomycetota bacterium]
MNRLLAYLTSLAIIILVLEAGARLLGLQPVVTINRFHDKLGWEKTPSTTTHKSTSEFDITYSVNSRGLRDDESVTYEKPAGEWRLLVVGDSFPLGYTVDRQDLFVDLLEQRLCAAGVPAQVVNGGTEGYSTDQEALWLRLEGLRYEPDLVLVTAYQNDIFWNSQAAYFGKSKPRLPNNGNLEAVSSRSLVNTGEAGFCSRASAIAATVSSFWTGLRYGVMEPDAKIPMEEAVVLTNEPGLITEAWNCTRTALQLLKQTCDEAKVPLVLAVIPSREQLQPASAEAYADSRKLAPGAWDPAQPARKMAALASSLGIDVLDATPALQAQAQAEPDLPLYFAKDWHFNAAGNRVFANALFEGLVQRQYLKQWPQVAESAPIPVAGESVEVAGFPPSWLVVVACIWAALSGLYILSYKDENAWLVPLKVGALVTVVVLLVAAIAALVDLAGPAIGRWVGLAIVLLVLGFLLWKTWRKLGIIREVMSSFTNRGYWYMIPLLVAMLTIGSLLVVAASSPFIAPFIYTLF